MLGVLLFLSGLAIGGASVAVAARLQIRRSLAKARAAERRARSAERLAEVGAMTSGLAHEIKNPLSTIGLNAQLLAEGVEDLPTAAPVAQADRERLARRLSSLRREVERLRGILTDFLKYAGELRLERAPIDVNQVIDELADFFLPQAEQQNVRLRVDLWREPLRAEVDAAYLKQAVLNLLLNALQALTGQKDAPPGAPREVILRTCAGRDLDKAPTVEVHVIDTGPGIPADVLPKIFTPYFTTKGGGTGLGLPTTRRIVEAHQGRLDVTTDPGRGTDFAVILPALAEVPSSRRA